MTSKETILINPSDSCRFNRYNQNWIINDKDSYDSDKYIISIDRTIKAKTESVKPVIKESVSVTDKEQELKSLSNFRSLSNKLKTLSNQIEKAKTTHDEDKFILLGRSINKSRQIISKHLNKLNADRNFKILQDKTQFVLSYKGQFVDAKSISPFTDGVL